MKKKKKTNKPGQTSTLGIARKYTLVKLHNCGENEIHEWKKKKKKTNKPGQIFTVGIARKYTLVKLLNSVIYEKYWGRKKKTNKPGQIFTVGIARKRYFNQKKNQFE